MSNEMCEAPWNIFTVKEYDKPVTDIQLLDTLRRCGFRFTETEPPRPSHWDCYIQYYWHKQKTFVIVKYTVAANDEREAADSALAMFQLGSKKDRIAYVSCYPSNPKRFYSKPTAQNEVAWESPDGDY